ncbi:endolytic transglycosylase MltG [Specibacter cremeus]|uniref:endolytic transglycosylase MltG n=1 Tax=Specibacter cremeus TaxID=1629051 RepID=UPI001F0C5451|nr:endolytic transglycosylase MltG [Specibacter cremeus]
MDVVNEPVTRRTGRRAARPVEATPEPLPAQFHHADGRARPWPDHEPAAHRAADPGYAGHGTDDHAADDHLPVDHAATDPYATDPYTAAPYPDEPHGHFADESLPSRRSSRVSKRVRKRRRTLAFLVVLALFAGVVFFVVQMVQPMLGSMGAADYPGPGTGSVQLVVPDGATARSVAAELKGEDIVASEAAFLDALTAAKGAGALQPGTFSMKKQMRAADAVAILLAVDGAKVSYAAVAQNLRIDEALAVLSKSTHLPLADFQKLANDPAQFDLPKQAKNLEGYLSPGEYRFPVDYTAKQVLADMVAATTKNLAAAGVTAADQQFRVLTIASIIEFEGNKANYAKISGAIENRLNNPNAETGGRLESDATVAYGLGIKTYNITAAQKADKSNKYNTFANPGLPVGPIGSPGADAIKAAAQPQANPYYFWVTVNLDTGETLYATTYAEHQKNVKLYQQWCTANPGKCG